MLLKKKIKCRYRARQCPCATFGYRAEYWFQSQKYRYLTHSSLITRMFYQPLSQTFVGQKPLFPRLSFVVHYCLHLRLIHTRYY